MTTLTCDIALRPNTHALFDGRADSSLIKLENCGPRAGYPPDAQFDVKELSIVDYLVGREVSDEWLLLPATLLGRFQHAYLCGRIDRGPNGPQDLAGRTIAARWPLNASTVWIRAILKHQYSVDAEDVRWLHLDKTDGPEGILSALRDNRADAGVPLDPSKEPGVISVIKDPAAAAAKWYAMTGAVQINHVAVVKRCLWEQQPQLVQELYRLIKRARGHAETGHNGVDCLPFGAKNLRASVELLVDTLLDAGLLALRPEWETLFGPGISFK